ncbi:hypothetical protein NQ095_19215 [Rossellomorea sp. SC111]|uniref:hypothetical protein n=1 Tax=Rossellomorea sp. SC111 TaxID=2968985 RepID=UPI00215A5971|nr:hypothetical protein [Rossellomorea sp. SC111]MCR8850554.1 hypothetical protein [Rossellomorea sp. SC111]
MKRGVKMSFMNIIEQVLEHNPRYLFIGSTARDSEKISLLPNRFINNELAMSILVTDEEICEQIINKFDGEIPTIFADTESKQDINIYQKALTMVKNSELLPYKPNDMTVEATDILINNIYGKDIYGKRILVLGTGNIAVKISLRLAERNCKVFIKGRNSLKVSNIVTVLNSILPRYSSNKVEAFEENINQLDTLISFVSAERVISSELLLHMKDNAYVVDGGINNLSEDAISNSFDKKLQFIRLDTRIGLPFVEAFSNSVNSEFFKEVIGKKIIEGIDCVSGGIIGNRGDIILDKIEFPTQIVGIANGIGGLLNEREYSAKNWQQLSTIKKSILYSK